jgi:hypothetical protein
MTHRFVALATVVLAAALQLAAQEPKDANGWEQLGITQQAAGKYTEAALSFQKALDAGYPPIGKYNLACALARLGQTDRVLALLTPMLANGATLPLATDHDFDGIRQDPRFQELVNRASELTEPCKHPKKHPEYRQLDFWLGEWDVFNTAGQKVGDSRIELLLKDCVVQENWTGTQGGAGKSYNQYDPTLGKWQQFWVADTGRTQYYTGEGSDGEMRYAAEGRQKDGSPLLVRLTFTKLEGNKVRQHAQQSTDGGKEWSTVYDFTYVPKKGRE